MKLTDRDLLDLDELISGAVDGRLSEPERARLERLLRESKEARRYYVRMMELSSNLCAFATRSEAEEDGTRAASRADHGHGSLLGGLALKGHSLARRRSARWLIATVSAACVLGLLSAVVVRNRPGGPPPRHRPSPRGKVDRGLAAGLDRRNLMDADALAMLTRVVGARWEPTTGLPIVEGEMLRAGRLRLAAGWVQVEFFSGASVILEGPADLELVSPERVFCRRGRLQTYVPTPAHGFTVGTPGVDAVDLGTEFALRVDERGGGEVHVLDGEVELHRTGGSPATGDVMKLKAGRGASFGTAEGLLEIMASPDEFVDRARLQQLEDAEKQQRHRRWQAYSGALRAEPATVLYYSFDAQRPWERTLRNVGPGRDATLDGAVVGCLWTEGRWPGKGALEFKRIGDRVRVDVPGRFESLTLATWVRIEGFDHQFNALLLNDRYEEPGDVHWQLSDHGEMILSVCGNVRIQSPPVLGPDDLGHWAHLASVYDARAKVVTHYLDGKPVCRRDVQGTVPLRIGAAEIGNWAPPTLRSIPIRTLNGRMDEFAIFRRALSGEEIGAMYEAGKPNS